MIDGSGLSRDDHYSPAQVLLLLRRVWHTPIGHVLLPSLPVVGSSVGVLVEPDDVDDPDLGH